MDRSDLAKERIKEILRSVGFVPKDEGSSSVLVMAFENKFSIHAAAFNGGANLSAWYPDRSVAVKLGKKSQFSIGGGPRFEGAVKRQVEVLRQKTEEIDKFRCPHCEGYMAERVVQNPDSDNLGRKFYGCLRFPECRGARSEWRKNFPDDDGKYVGVKCPECSSEIVIRYVKKPGPYQGGRFYGCLDFPKCTRVVSEEELTALKLMGEQGESDNPFGELKRVR